MGFGEIIIIILVSVLFIHPSKLPKIARKLGSLYRKIINFKDIMNNQVDDFINTRNPEDKNTKN